MKYIVLVSRKAIPESVEFLEQKGFEVVFQTSESEADLCKDIEFCDAFLMYEGIVNKYVIDNAKHLKVIGKNSVGLDSIDVEYAEEKGIVVTNARGANSQSTAEHTMALLLACAKNIVQMDSLTRQGLWLRQEMPTTDLVGKNLGVIGLGAIGSRVANMASAGFNMNIISFDNYASEELKEKYNAIDSIDSLLKRCDFVTLHLPLTKETRNLMDLEKLKMMKKSAYLINCARGAVINEDDLYLALKENIIKGAGLDVFSVEPVEKENNLFSLPNVIVSPHNASFTEDTISRMWLQAAKGIYEVLSGHESPWACNQPKKKNK